MRARPTVRKLMILVAVVAVAFAANQMRQRRRFYLDKADQHAEFVRTITRTPSDIAYWEARWADQRSGLGASGPWPAGPPFVPAIVAYHTTVERQYRRAARYPWLSISPETPGM